MTDTQLPTKNLKNLSRHSGIFYAGLSLAFVVGASGITLPFLQTRRDALGCDAVCYGAMTSARSALALVGSTVIGRLSDRIGRVPCLYVGVIAMFVSVCLSAASDTIEGMWVAMAVQALFSQNFGVMKALVADYAHEWDLSATARAGMVGKLGMAVGLAFMVGPICGATLIGTFEATVKVAICLVILAGITLFKVPSPPRSEPSTEAVQPSSWRSFFNVKAAGSPGAVFLMCMRVCMALSFHIYMTIWTVSLKSRFNFGPKEHGTFMSLVGLFYALSQGVIAKQVLKMAGERRRVLVLLVCIVSLGLGRVFAFYTGDLLRMYSIFSVMIVALGIVNTIITADVTNLASAKEIGGLFGLLESVESIAGIIGPFAGGALARIADPVAPLVSIVVLYGICFGMIIMGYTKFVINGQVTEGEKEKAQ